MGFAGAGRAEEDHVVAFRDERAGRQVRDDVPGGGGDVVEDEVLDGLDLWEVCGGDPQPGAVRRPGGDLAAQDSSQVLLMGPALGAGPVTQSGERVGDHRCLQLPRQEADLAGQVLHRGGHWDGLPWWGQVLVTAVIVAGLMAFGVGFAAAAAAATAGVATYIAGHGEGLAALIEDPDRTVAEYVATATPLRVGMDAVDFGLTFIPGSWLGRLPFLPAARRLAGQWAAAAAERVKPLLSRTRVVEPIAVPSLHDVGRAGTLHVIGDGFSDSERAAAQMFVDEGCEVLLREADPAAPRMSDLLVNGIPYDVYTPKAGTPIANILSAAARKFTQVGDGGGVIIDLQATGLTSSDFQNALNRVNGMLRSWGHDARLSDIRIVNGVD